MPVDSDDNPLTLRNLAPALRRSLQARAIANGRSIEDEARAILADALARTEPAEVNLAEAIRRRFAPVGGVELEDHPAVGVSGVISL